MMNSQTVPENELRVFAGTTVLRTLELMQRCRDCNWKDERLAAIHIFSRIASQLCVLVKDFMLTNYGQQVTFTLDMIQNDVQIASKSHNHDDKIVSKFCGWVLEPAIRRVLHQHEMRYVLVLVVSILHNRDKLVAILHQIDYANKICDENEYDNDFPRYVELNGMGY